MFDKYPGLKTSVFWSAMIGAIFMLIQAALTIFGVNINEDNSNQLLMAINAIIGALVIAGILIDPTDVESYNKLTKKVKLKE